MNEFLINDKNEYCVTRYFLFNLLEALIVEERIEKSF